MKRAENSPATPAQPPKGNRSGSTTAAEEPANAESWHLRLYVAGQSARSLVAFRNLKQLCEEHLKGRYRIEVIDLSRQPELAQQHEIVALPTLVRMLPPPVRRVIGDLSNTERVKISIDLRPGVNLESR